MGGRKGGIVLIFVILICSIEFVFGVLLCIEFVFLLRYLLLIVEWEICNFEIGYERNYLNRELWIICLEVYGWFVLYIFCIFIIFIGKLLK